MKIKTKKLAYEKVLKKVKPKKRQKPAKPSRLLAKIIGILSKKDLSDTNFTYEFPDRDKAGKSPFFIIMNHSSFIDLEIVNRIFYPMRYNIVCTSDGFVGKYSLMRAIGCIPTRKFVTDPLLIGDISYALHHNKTSVLMFPEASYSFDGTATPLPSRLGLLFKRLNVPVIMVRTYGAFTRDPLYNGLKKRKVNVSAKVSVLFEKDELSSMSVQEMDERLENAFSFDNFAWQKENGIVVGEKFRADGLERILYKCPHCGSEGTTKGNGEYIKCSACGKTFFLNELGEISATAGEKTEFSHIPDWYAWQRECVRQQLSDGTYKTDIPVKIGMLVDYKELYEVGEGRLTHDRDGFVLTGCDGKLRYEQKASSSYGLYADYFWYEIGDVICIGDKNALYYCFPTNGFPVAKARLAAEEAYKLCCGKKRRD